MVRIKIAMLISAINMHSGEKNLVSFIANLVRVTFLKTPKNLKSPIALKKKIIAINKVPYRKYFPWIYLSNNPKFPIVINAINNSPKAIRKPAAIPGFIFFNPLEFVGNTSTNQSFPPNAQ